MLERAPVDKLELVAALMDVDGSISLQSLRRLADAPFKEWDALASILLDSRTFYTQYMLAVRSQLRTSKKQHAHFTEATVFWHTFSGEKP